MHARITFMKERKKTKRWSRVSRVPYLRTQAIATMIMSRKTKLAPLAIKIITRREDKPSGLDERSDSATADEGKGALLSTPYVKSRF